MRLDLESTPMTLSEFVDRVIASNEPIEVTRDDKVIITAKSKHTSVQKVAGKPAENLDDTRTKLKHTWRNMKAHQSKGKQRLTERQAVKVATELVEQSRRALDSRDR